jgi:hypothetical protein
MDPEGGGYYSVCNKHLTAVVDPLGYENAPPAFRSAGVQPLLSESL